MYYQAIVSTNVGPQFHWLFYCLTTTTHFIGLTNHRVSQSNQHIWRICHTSLTAACCVAALFLWPTHRVSLSAFVYLATFLALPNPKHWHWRASNTLSLSNPVVNERQKSQATGWGQWFDTVDWMPRRAPSSYKNLCCICLQVLYWNKCRRKIMSQSNKVYQKQTAEKHQWRNAGSGYYIQEIGSQRPMQWNLYWDQRSILQWNLYWIDRYPSWYVVKPKTQQL